MVVDEPVNLCNVSTEQNIHTSVPTPQRIRILATFNQRQLDVFPLSIIISIHEPVIKLFRTIRQKLLPENKFSKYLIYAIGEIVLVVIGILIALQINNWNQREQVKETELKTLHFIKK